MLTRVKNAFRLAPRGYPAPKHALTSGAHGWWVTVVAGLAFAAGTLAAHGDLFSAGFVLFWDAVYVGLSLTQAGPGAEKRMRRWRATLASGHQRAAAHGTLGRQVRFRIALINYAMALWLPAGALAGWLLNIHG